MTIKIIAVGQHIAEWAQIATQDYLNRFPRDFRVELREVRTEHRSGQPPAKLMQAEAERILASFLMSMATIRTHRALPVTSLAGAQRD